jgi:hypothetical protein
MPITAFLPPITGDTTDCANVAEHIVFRFHKLQKDWLVEGDIDRTDLWMREAYSVVMGKPCDDANLKWLKTAEEFWRQPVHVQKLHVEVGILRASLKTRQDFLEWLTRHVQSSKFQGEGNNFINVHDIIHALGEHGVYGG